MNIPGHTLQKMDRILRYTILILIVIMFLVLGTYILSGMTILMYVYAAVVVNGIIGIMTFSSFYLHNKIKDSIMHDVASMVYTTNKQLVEQLQQVVEATDEIATHAATYGIENVEQYALNIKEQYSSIHDTKTIQSAQTPTNIFFPHYGSIGNGYIAILKELVLIIQSYRNKIYSLYMHLGTLCPVHLPLDLADEWAQFIDSRFESSFEMVKRSIQSIQKIQSESIEYVNYVLELLKGFKDKRAVQYEEMMSFYARMRNTQESFAQYLSTVSQTFQFIKEIMTQVEEITDKINILSLNMSIEANKLTGNNVFSIIAKELHAFSEQTIKYFDPMKKTIEQNLNVIEEKKKEEQEAIAQIQEFINISEKMVKEYENNIDQFTKLIDNITKMLLKQDGNVKENIFQQFEDIQKLVIIKEEMSHRDEFNQTMLQKVNNVIQQLIRDHKVCQGFDCQYRIDSFKLIEGLITTAGEREFLKQLYKKYLNKELEEEEHKQGDVILF